MKLIEAARRCIEAGASANHRWIELGLPETTLSDLQRSVETFEKTLTDRRQYRNTAASSLDTVQTTVRQALDALRRLDVMMPNKLGGDSATLAAWNKNRGVGVKRPRRARGETPVTAAATVVPAETTAASPPSPAAAPTTDRPAAPAEPPAAPAEPTPAPKPNPEPALI